MAVDKGSRFLVTLLTAGISIILVLIPFHAFLTIWLASFVGHYLAVRLWKEYILLLLVVVAWILVLRSKAIRNYMWRSWLFWLIVAYIVLHLIIGFIAWQNHAVTAEAFGYALIINLRIFIFFWVCLVAGIYAKTLPSRWVTYLIIPGVIVIVFALLQEFLLPHNFLAHFGYGPATIKPYETIDQNQQFFRTQSTLRGANPFGAYIVVLATAALYGALKLKTQGKRIMWTVFTILCLVVLYYTYSRSAWIGTFVSFCVLIFFLIRSQKTRLILSLIGTGVIIIGGISAYALRHNVRFEDTFLHTSSNSKSLTSSNQDHASALEKGLKDVIHQPFGRGPGTAGPASIYNDNKPRIAENYYIQLAQEVGVIGLAIFIAINVMVVYMLYKRRNGPALILFASYIGLIVVNMLLHGWADDTLSYIWWGLAGLILAPAILGGKANNNETPKTKKTAAL